MLDPKFQKYYILALSLAGIVFLTLFNLKLNVEASLKKSVAFRPNSERDQTTSKFASLLSKPQVLAVKATPSPTPKPKPPKLSKNTYVIATIGDSMVETMGNSLDYLSKNLRKKYPNTDFVFYNYGVGSENVEAALLRFDKKFNYLDKDYPPLPHIRPDVLIVGSYSYNPLFPYDPAKQKKLLEELLNRAKSVSKNTYLLAEISPLEDGFGHGVGGVNWAEDTADAHALKIIEQLNNTISLANSSGVYLIDVYTQSLKRNSLYGRKEYVDNHDGIHPSVLGQTFTADIIAKTIKLP